MQNFIIQQMYNFIGNNALDKSTDELNKKVLDHFKDKLSEKDLEDLLGMLVEVNKNGFEMGVKSVSSLFTGKDEF